MNKPLVRYRRISIFKKGEKWELHLEGREKVVARSVRWAPVLTAAIRQAYYDGLSDGTFRTANAVEALVEVIKAHNHPEDA